MNTKEQLIKAVREWVRIDNEIKELQAQVNKRKQEKKKISTILIDIMRDNEIDCFDIQNGQIMYCKKNVKKPITKKTLFNILSKYYKGDETKAEMLQTFILDNREETIQETIIRK